MPDGIANHQQQKKHNAKKKENQINANKTRMIKA